LEFLRFTRFARKWSDFNPSPLTCPQSYNNWRFARKWSDFNTGGEGQ